MQQQVQAWLENPADYHHGVSLLEAVGIRGIVLRTLKLGEDACNREQLEAKLRDWLQNNVLPIASPATRLTEFTSVKPASGGTKDLVYSVPMSEIPSSVSQIPSGVQLIKDQTQDLMNERSELKARIRACKDDAAKQAERRDWAFRILAITDQLDELFSRLDFFGQYGYLPPTEEPAAEVDETALLMNVRSYVSRYKARLRKTTLTVAQRQSFERLLAQYSAEKERLEYKLSNQNDSYTSGQQTSDRPIHSTPFPRT